MQEFLPAHVVKETLANTGGKFVRVTFKKKDNTTTTRVGRPKTYSRRVGGVNGPEATPEAIERSKRAAQALKDGGNVWLDYPNPDKRDDGKRGFSFNTGRVIGIGPVGEHTQA